jgi:hypothetical protein
MIMNPTLEQKMVIACDEEKWQEDIDRIYAEGYEEGVAEIKAEMVKIQEEMVELKKKDKEEKYENDFNVWRDACNEFTGQYPEVDQEVTYWIEFYSGDVNIWDRGMLHTKKVMDGMYEDMGWYFDIEEQTMVMPDSDEEEDYDTDNEEHSHKCDNCSKNAHDDQHLCGHCRSEE